MREYGQIQCSFWSDPDIQTLSDQGKLLFAYLLTGPHSNGLGCYRLPDGYVQADFEWSQQTVSKGFGELFEKGFAYRCTETCFVVIPNFLRWNPITNGNVAAARIKEFETVPKRASVYGRLIKALQDHGKHLPEPFRNRLETLSNGLPKGYGKQDPTLPDPEPDPTHPTAGPQADAARGYSPEFEQAWREYPSRGTADNPKRRAYRAWCARLKAGHSAETLTAGVSRYRRWCEATGKINTETVKQAATFFGPDEPFLHDWKIPNGGSNATRQPTAAERFHDTLQRVYAESGGDG